MTEKTAASAATDKHALLQGTAINARMLMEKRIDSLVDTFSCDGDWFGDVDSAQELAEMVAMVKALETAAEAADDREMQIIDIELPSGATFSAYLEQALAEELQRNLDRLKADAAVVEVPPHLVEAEANVREVRAQAEVSFHTVFADALRRRADTIEAHAAQRGGLNEHGRKVIKIIRANADAIDPPKPVTANPEAAAKAKLDQMDAAKGIADRRYAFAVDPDDVGNRWKLEIGPDGQINWGGSATVEELQVAVSAAQFAMDTAALHRSLAEA